MNEQELEVAEISDILAHYVLDDAVLKMSMLGATGADEDTYAEASRDVSRNVTLLTALAPDTAGHLLLQAALAHVSVATRMREDEEFYEWGKWLAQRRSMGYEALELAGLSVGGESSV